MFSSLVLLSTAVLVTAQYAPQANSDHHGASPPTQYLPRNNVMVIPVYMNRWRQSSSSSESKCCKRCKYLITSCSNVPEGYECYQPKIANFINKDDCKAAVLSCGNSDDFVTLQTINGEVLSKGKYFQKYVKCENNEKWLTRDIQNKNVNFRTVRCLRRRSSFELK